MKNGFFATLVGAVILAGLVFWSVQQTAGVARVIENHKERIVKCEASVEKNRDCIMDINLRLTRMEGKLDEISQQLKRRND